MLPISPHPPHPVLSRGVVDLRYLLYEILYQSLRWERSSANVKCRVCRKSDRGDEMLLCDSCDKGFHMYCLKPALKEIPEGFWCAGPRPRLRPPPFSSSLRPLSRTGYCTG